MGHWSYERLERLQALGVIDGLGLSSRPLTRIQIARLIAQAIEGIEEGGFEQSALDYERSDLVEETLYELIDEYRTELIRLGFERFEIDDNGTLCGEYKLLQSVTCAKALSGLSAEEETVIENERSRRINDGLNSRISALSWFWWRSFIAASLSPSLNLTTDEIDPDLLEGSVNLSFLNIILEAGRTSMWWGPGHHGALLLSSNAQALDVVRLKNDRPFRLPSFLRRLGLFHCEVFLSQLEDKRVIPHALLTGMRIAYRPWSWVIFGFNHTVQFGGEGEEIPPIIDLFDLSKAGGGEEGANHIVSVDGKIRLTRLLRYLPIANGLVAYGEFGAEDESNMRPHFIGFLMGCYISDLFKIPKFDYRVEFAQNDYQWYNHFKYRTGYWYRGDLIGHHMGSNAQDLFMRFSRTFSNDLTVGMDFDIERSGRTLAVVETKGEWGLNFSFPYKEDNTITVGYRMQIYRDFRNRAGEDEINHILLCEVVHRF
ncbi:MAG: hypothetical protein JW844_01070 [Candidatus Omnitrophica bacterium]|nr:hypothetical protein [Candidatus Omnitrophota bacterium]